MHQLPLTMLSMQSSKKLQCISETSAYVPNAKTLCKRSLGLARCTCSENVLNVQPELNSLVYMLWDNGHSVPLPAAL